MIGAEAVITFDKETVTKERKVKGYRHPQLDEQLRKKRTRAEARILEKARVAGVPVPAVETIDESTLQLEKIEGQQVKEVLDKQPALAEEIGRNVRKLHDSNIIHGDLTTSNMIYNKKITFIDFGLSFSSQRDEDKAVDMHVFKQALEKHPTVAEEAFEHFRNGYGSSDVWARFKKVEARGRNKGG
ncbi:MAG: KEOPS complex kinase/ATPase Bud32 [Candidatus Woesearchaeota archaeon]|nr:KEOPS complex kinase/ATPase Bud32 [Candidatus Woesearchaeota archaeon]